MDQLDNTEKRDKELEKEKQPNGRKVKKAIISNKKNLDSQILIGTLEKEVLRDHKTLGGFTK